MRSIPIPIRERILELYGQGWKTKDIASSMGFCVAAVRRVRQQFAQRGSLRPQTDRCGRKSLLTVERKARLEELLALKPDATLAELGSQMDRPFGTSTVDLWLRQLGWDYKKRCTPPNRPGRTSPNQDPAGMSWWRRRGRGAWCLSMKVAPTHA